MPTNQSAVIQLPPDGTGKRTRSKLAVEVHYVQLVGGKSFAVGDHIRFVTSGVHGNVMAVSTKTSTTGVIVLQLHNDHQYPTQLNTQENIERHESGSYVQIAVVDGADWNHIHVPAYTLVGANNLMRGQYIDPYGAAYTRFSEGSPQFDGTGMMQQSGHRLLGKYGPEDNGTKYHVMLMGAGAAQTHDEDAHARKFSVASAVNEQVHVRTHKFHFHQPGISTYAEITLQHGDAGKANHKRLWGLYTTENGCFFELDGTDLYIVHRTNSTGTIVDTRTAQSDWNTDPVNGGNSSVSKMILDITKVNKYWIEVTCTMGTGTTRMGVFGEDGTRIVCHEIHGNNVSSTGWLAHGDLPVHFGLQNDPTTPPASGSEITFYWAGVWHTGLTYNIRGKAFETCMDAPQTGANTSTWSHLLSLRPKTLNIHGHTNHAVMLPTSISISSVDSVDLFTPRRVKVEVWLGTTITGGATWTKDKDLSEADVSTATTWTGGTAVGEWIVAGTETIDLTTIFNYEEVALLNDYDGTQKVLTFGVKQLDGAFNTSVIAAINWQQIGGT